MKKWIVLFSLLLLLAAGLLIAKKTADRAIEAVIMKQEAQTLHMAEETQTSPSRAAETTEGTTEAPTEPSAETTAETAAPPPWNYSQEEEQLLLKIAMAERGNTGCTTCIALVMRTILNRVEGPRFSSTIRGVVYAEGQFPPAEDGTLETAVPNQQCYEALDMIKQGWDESQGAMYYEWIIGESWHSQNLNLLFQHCDVRFYN